MAPRTIAQIASHVRSIKRHVPISFIGDCEMLDHAADLLAAQARTLDDFTRTLESIANNRCCHCCGEAAKVAQAALYRAGTVQALSKHSVSPSASAAP